MYGVWNGSSVHLVQSLLLDELILLPSVALHKVALSVMTMFQVKTKNEVSKSLKER